VVTLSGSIDDRVAKRRAEDLAESCAGVRDVRNELRVSRD
jgi:osmotically-inducible protein OsmY